MTSQLTINDPFYRRFFAWINERFPLSHAVLFAILYALSVLWVRSATSLPLFSLSDIVSFCAVWSFFLLLRILDEHKDYANDVKFFPHRILQSGLITLAHLRYVGLACVLLQLGWSVYLDQGFGAVTLAWVFIVFWVVLMTNEFFCHDWLSKHLFVYAFSHMLVMPLVILWMMQLGGRSITGYTFDDLLFVALSFIGGFTFEITRKTKGPEEEQTGLDTYSSLWGITGALRMIVLLLLMMEALVLYFLITKFALAGAALMVAAICLLGVFSYTLMALKRFKTQPSAITRDKNEKATAVNMLTCYSVIIASILLPVT